MGGPDAGQPRHGRRAALHRRALPLGRCSPTRGCPSCWRRLGPASRVARLGERADRRAVGGGGAVERLLQRLRRLLLQGADRPQHLALLDRAPARAGGLRGAAPTRARAAAAVARGRRRGGDVAGGGAAGGAEPARDGDGGVAEHRGRRDRRAHRARRVPGSRRRAPSAERSGTRSPREPDSRPFARVRRGLPCEGRHRARRRALPRGGVGARRRPALRAASQTPARKRGSSRRPPAQLTANGRAEAEVRREIGHQLRQRDLGARHDGPRDGMPAPRRAQGRRRQRGHPRHRVGTEGEPAQREGAGARAARRGARRGRSRTPSPRHPAAGRGRPRARAGRGDRGPARWSRCRRGGECPGRSPRAPSRAASTSEITRTRRARPRSAAAAARRSAGVHTPREATTSAPTWSGRMRQRRRAARTTAGRARTATAPRRRRRVRPASSRASTRSVVPPRSQPMAHVARAARRPRIRVGMHPHCICMAGPTRRA